MIEVFKISFLLFAVLLLESTTSFTPRIHPSSFFHDIYNTGMMSRQKDSGRIRKLYAIEKGDDQDEDAQQDPSSSSAKKKEKKQPSPTIANSEDPKEIRKRQIGLATRSLVNNPAEDNDNNNNENGGGGLLDKLNPFQVGKNLRKSLDSAITSLARASSAAGVSSLDTEQRSSIYYLDDRFQDSGGALFTQESNPYLSRLAKEDYIPEVLVVGATGEVGRLVVRRLLLEGRCRCRCLVSDLYSRTLDMLGTGVVYCQGDLSNLDSLEYALTDVDKIVVCEGAPRSDDDDDEGGDDKTFREKFLGFAQDNLEGKALGKIVSSEKAKASDAAAWERLESVLEVRAKLAEHVDYVGMQNLVRAYQNVRYADYGTSQAAKRSLFKFHSREGDFVIFDIDKEDVVASERRTVGSISSESPLASGAPSSSSSSSKPTAPQQQDYSYETSQYEDIYNEYNNEDEYANDNYEDDISSVDAVPPIEQRQDASVQTQVKWIRNEFGHGVFVGKVPRATESSIGGDASIVSTRLRTRDSENGLDLSGGFGGFVCRACADGGIYEAFIRNDLYEKSGIEYVCEFNTGSKQPRKGNASRNKFMTVRLPFEAFTPVRRRTVVENGTQESIPSFDGKDVRYLGFRFRSSRNQKSPRRKKQEGGMTSFYIALSYIKLYRTQPEPEFVYLSDARIPPVVLDAQVRHDIHQIVPLETALNGMTGNSFQMFNDNILKGIKPGKMTASATNRIPEETYYKYRGEQILKNSGLRCVQYGCKFGCQFFFKRDDSNLFLAFCQKLCDCPCSWIQRIAVQ
jgi:NAD(P)H-binding